MSDKILYSSNTHVRQSKTLLLAIPTRRERQENTSGVVVSTACCFMLFVHTSRLSLSRAHPLFPATDCENTECGHSANDCSDAVDPSTVVTTGSTTTDSETSTSASTNTCGADGEACGADIVCDQCAQIFLGADETCRDPGFDRTTATCSEIFEGFCCAIELAEDAGCASNDLWLALYGG